MYINDSQIEKKNWQVLLNFFDYFLYNKKFTYIKKLVFKLRLVHVSQRSTKVINNDFKRFEILSNFIDHEEKTKNNKKNGSNGNNENNKLDKNNGNNKNNKLSKLDRSNELGV